MILGEFDLRLPLLAVCVGSNIDSYDNSESG